MTGLVNNAGWSSPGRCVRMVIHRCPLTGTTTVRRWVWQRPPFRFGTVVSPDPPDRPSTAALGLTCDYHSSYGARTHVSKLLVTGPRRAGLRRLASGVVPRVLQASASDLL